MAPINVGLVGYGNSARVFHLPYILKVPDLKLYAFMQRAPAPATGSRPDKPHCTIDYPDAKHYSSLDTFLADDAIELVVVLTQQDSHAEIAEKALRAGKHVVVEKPITETLEQAERLVQAKNETGKLLIPFQNRRYDSDFATVQELVAKNAFGEVLEYETHYDLDLTPWVTGIGSSTYKPGQGLMFGIGVHKFDQVLHLFGRPATVTAWLQNARPGAGDSDIEDSYTVILTYDPSGPFKNLLVTVKTLAADKLLRPLAYLVRGREGAFIKFGDDPQEAQIQVGKQVTDAGFGVEEEAIWGELSTTQRFCEAQKEVKGKWVGKYESKRGSYTSYYADVAKAIRGGEQVVKIETSRDGIKLCEVARASALQRKTLPFA